MSNAETLLAPSGVMILDEPTDFLELLDIVWLQRFLLSRLEQAAGRERERERDGDATRRVLLLVNHGRDFVDIVCDETIITRDKTLPYCRSGTLRQRMKPVSARGYRIRAG